MIDFPKRHRVPFDGRFRVADFDTEPPQGSGTEAKLEAGLRQSVSRLDELQRRLFADQLARGIIAAGPVGREQEKAPVMRAPAGEAR